MSKAGGRGTNQYARHGTSTLRTAVLRSTLTTAAKLPIQIRPSAAAKPPVSLLSQEKTQELQKLARGRRTPPEVLTGLAPEAGTERSAKR